MDPSFQFEARFRNWLKMRMDAADAKNYEAKYIFYLELDSWKQHALTNPAYGKPVPEKPAVPETVKIDEAKAREAFAAWASHPEFVPGLNIGGDGPKKSYEVWTALVVPASDWNIHEQEAEQPKDPVSQIDVSTKGRYNIAAGDKTPLGTIIAHPKYGNLRRLADPSPFSPSHYFQAADQAALDTWHRYYFEALMALR